ncbi:DUF4870 domain-containing protein [Gloeothece verrucosa]|uniref:DUF4870 domain-containing protein n=1 Tax=Gloeothece verrucosa (strain PCC 7822) TaxID=497965 RepID=E0ULI6_GLOV7|nr:DUF4870 domain-containing protein [Gloeothece verrucosa]ADN17816.1 conserved hypothetical protein [Gloeothece verrucosa PCC 7822]
MAILEEQIQAIPNEDKRKYLSAGSHASIFISSLVVSIGIPCAIGYVSEDNIVKENTAEAINFHLNVWFYGAIIAFLSFISFGLLGLILVPIWLVYHWGLSIWAVIHCLNNPDVSFRYPLIFRLV